MSDERRALGFLERCPSDPFNTGADEAVGLLAAEFAAVRAEERAAIVRWLRPRAEWGLLPSSYCDQIANGEHEAPR